MKKLTLDVAQVQVLSFTMEADTDKHWFGDVSGTCSTSGTDIDMTCPSCPAYCFPANTNPDFC